MQKETPQNHPSTTLNPLKDSIGVVSVDYSSQFNALSKKVENLKNFVENGSAEGAMLQYLPGLAEPKYQGQIKGINERKAFADETYTAQKIAEFNIQLSNNEYMNFHNLQICFPLKIKKKTNVNNDIDNTMITVNNFFAHWIKEIDIKKLGDDQPILPTINTVEIYKYSDQILKHLPSDALELIENDLLYSKKKVKLPDGEDRRKKFIAANGDADERTDDNLDQRIEKFQNQLKNVFVYRIPLKYICELGFVNQPVKFDTKWRIIFEGDMSRLFESKANLADANTAIPAPDVKIILDSAPFLLYHQFNLEDTYRTYLEGALVSSRKLRGGIKLFPYQKSYEIVAGAQSKTFNFTNAFKQFEYLEISLVYDKSDQHVTIYDSYNAEIAATHIKSVKLQNASNTYSEFNTVKFDLEDDDDKYNLYNQFRAWVTKGSSIVPDSEFIHNKTAQEITKRKDYFSNSDERIYIDLRRGKGFTGEFERVNRDDSELSVVIDLKAAAADKMRIYLTGYYQAEYIYTLTKNGLIMIHKEYSVSKIKNK